MTLFHFCYCYEISARRCTFFICIHCREKDVSSFYLGEHWGNLWNNEPAVLKNWTNRWTMVAIAYINYKVDREGTGLIQYIHSFLVPSNKSNQYYKKCCPLGNCYPFTSFFKHTCAVSRVQVELQRIQAIYTIIRVWQSKKDKQGEQWWKEEKYHYIQIITENRF